jgi:hypothetical protein
MAMRANSIQGNQLFVSLIFLFSAGNAIAGCEKPVIKWLQSNGFSPAEAMEWCNATVDRARSVVDPPKSTAGDKAVVQDDEGQKNQVRTQNEAKPEILDTGKTNSLKDKKQQENSQQVNPLSSFSTSSSNGSSLVTAHIATAFSPAFLEHSRDTGGDYGRWYNDIGVDISASLPAQSTTLKQYAKQAVLSLDGGVLNIYGSFAGRDLTKGAYSGGDKNPRNKTVDRIYFDSTNERPDQMLGYIKQGIGLRGVKTALEGNGYGGLATLYLGLGIDGPLLSSTTVLLDKDPGAGWMSLEAYGTANAMNRRTMETLFATPSSHSGFFSGGAKLQIGLPGKFFLSAEYAKALGSYARKSIGDTSIISFGYNSDKSAEKK